MILSLRYSFTSFNHPFRQFQKKLRRVLEILGHFVVCYPCLILQDMTVLRPSAGLLTLESVLRWLQVHVDLWYIIRSTYILKNQSIFFIRTHLCVKNFIFFLLWIVSNTIILVQLSLCSLSLFQWIEDIYFKVCLP